MVRGRVMSKEMFVVYAYFSRRKKLCYHSRSIACSICTSILENKAKACLYIYNTAYECYDADASHRANEYIAPLALP
jgi:hypothetical protein